MNKQKKFVLSFLTFIALSFASFKGYLWYQDQSTSYVRFEVKDEIGQYIEYKPSLFELRSSMESEGLSRDQAILKLLSESLKGFPSKYSSCQIENVFGSINRNILAQVRCKHES